MKIGIIIYSDDSETVWNAFRFGNFAAMMDDELKVFFIGKGVEAELLDRDAFKVAEQLQEFLEGGGKVYICSTCLEIHQLKAPAGFVSATLKELYAIVNESDKIVTF